MGLASNTPDYVWKLEVGKRSIAVEALRRAENFVLEIYRIKVNRWPRNCLVEEIKTLRNVDLSKWGKQVEKGLKGQNTVTG